MNFVLVLKYIIFFHRVCDLQRHNIVQRMLASALARHFNPRLYSLK